ncbi:MAG TPA: di-heme oxidoredictase family protein [Candidatus Acidoferrales bacterium]|nr:di-heme oxidoredictase family protein [Candidatus Acidoferrales bacterium]
MRKISLLASGLGLGLCFGLALALAPQDPEAPAGFDGQTNGLVDQATHTADQAKFDEIEQISDGLGPLYNAQSCRECHQNPTSGGVTQTTELRVGHRNAKGQFENPSIPINDGKAVITGRTLVNDRAICPSGAFPNIQLQERAPDTETIRTNRLSLNLLGDGFVEAVPDQALLDIAKDQCGSTHRRICGQALYVPILEAPGKTGIGRFGWKDQHASLLSFAADAYLNEMGITNKLQPDEVTLLCNTVSEPNDTPGPDGLEDIDHFARFIRATEAPPHDAALSQTPEAIEGSRLFDQAGCSTCHVRTLVTAPAGAAIDGGTFTVPAALGGKQFHPYGDFLLHDVGTGDGIPVAVQEHYGKTYMRHAWPNFSYQELQAAANKVRTAPLWGVRTHSRLMHDGASLTLSDAIERHGGEAAKATEKFRHLKPRQKAALLAFLKSL